MSSLWRIGEKEINYIKKAIDSGLTGKMNQELEQKFANKFNMKYAIGVNSGTSALHCSLAAMGINANDEVIVPPLTFASTAFSALYLSGVPVFADIDPNTFNINPQEIEKKITSKTKAIIPVSLYGLSADMDPIMDIAAENDLYVLEDCAQSFLAKYKGKIAGTIGNMSIFSFERSKHMTSGNGGIILTNDEELAEKARKFSILGYSTLKAGAYETKPSKDLIQDPDFNRHLFVAPNYRLPELCAAMATAQLERLDEFVSKRRKIAKIYTDVISSCDWLFAQETPNNYVNSYFTCAMRIDGLSWKDFRNAFLKNGGDTFYGAWKLTYLEPALLGMQFKDNNIQYHKGLCPVAEKLQPQIIQLKTNYESLEHANNQANILNETIEQLNNCLL